MLTKIQKFATTNGYTFEMDDLGLTLTINDTIYFDIYFMDNEITVGVNDSELVKNVYKYPDTFKTQKQAIQFIEKYLSKKAL